VERVQDVGPSDVRAEGCTKCEYRHPDEYGPPDDPKDYSDLWDMLNEKRGFGWSTNPWVWAIEFKRVMS